MRSPCSPTCDSSPMPVPPPVSTIIAAPARLDRRDDGIGEAVTGCGDQSRGVGVLFDDQSLIRIAPCRCPAGLPRRSRRHPAGAGPPRGNRGFLCAATGARASGRPVRLSVAMAPVCGRLSVTVSLARDQLDLQFADRPLHRAVDPAGEPARQDVERGLVLQAGHQRGVQRLVGRLVQRRRQQCAPVGDAAPRQVACRRGYSPAAGS